METKISNSLFLCDVEDGLLYELPKQKQGKLLKKFPTWYDYGADDNELSEVLEYFKQHGRVVASTRTKNLFAGFTA